MDSRLADGGCPMPNWVTLPVLNTLRFGDDPVPITKLRRWCRNGGLPARRIEREWWVDLDAFDYQNDAEIDPLVAAVTAKLN